MEKFQPIKPEKETITVRLPISLIQEIDRKSADADISRNEFINQCILFAMKHLAAPSGQEPQ